MTKKALKNCTFWSKQVDNLLKAVLVKKIENIFLTKMFLYKPLRKASADCCVGVGEESRDRYSK